MSLGALVYDERIVPIERICLEHGCIVFVGECDGPVSVHTTIGVTVHGADGQLIGNAPGVRCEWPDVPRGMRVVIRQPFTFEGRLLANVKTALS